MEVREVKANSVTLTWRNKTSLQCHSLIVEHRMKQETDWTSVKKTEETVTLSELELDTEYEIRVTAMGKKRCVVSRDIVTAVTGKTAINPSANVVVQEVKADSITLSWRNPNNQQCQCLIVEQKIKHKTDWTSVQKNQETLSVSGLVPDTEYEIRVTAMDKQGCSVSSDVITAVTAKTTMNPPTNLEIKEVKANSFTLTWRNPSGQQCRFLIVEYRMTHETEWTESDPVKKTTEMMTVSALKLDTEYHIRVTAVGKQGCSVRSDVVTTVTAKSTMIPPTNLEVKEVKTDSITLTWRKPSDQECRFLIVEYRMTHETEWIESDPVKMNQETATLSKLELDTEYEIRVTAVGKKGCSVSSDIVTAVTAKTTMKPPTNVVVKEVKADSITLTWRKPSDQECRFLIVEYRKTLENEWTESDPVQKTQETATLSGLKLDTEYEIRVTSVGKKGCSVSSDIVTAVTKAISPPTNLEIQEVKADSIMLTWRNPSDQQYQSLFIEYRKKQETEWTTDPLKKTQEEKTLSGLELGTEYEIKVRAVGKQGCPVSSDIVTAVTAKTTMKPPTNVVVKEVKADSITLTWRKPSDQECRFLIVEYRKTLENEWTESDPVQKTQETATLSGLKLDTEYEIRVTAVGKQGCSISSDVVTAKTTISSPAEVKVEDMTAYSVSRDVITVKPTTGPPTNVKVIEKKANSITLNWLNPENCEGVKQYLIEYKEEHSNCWQKHETKKEVYKCTLKNLKLNTSYSIRMRTDAGSGMSEYGNILLAKTMAGPQDENRFTPLPSGNPPLYRLNLKTASTVQFNKMVFGQAKPLNNPSNKTIMFVGATGSGKTTLINGIINYILGVDWEDNWRFKLIDEATDKTQAHSQTSEVTAYQIYHTDEFQVPYSLTIIDTPGFGDTRGIKYDKKITDKIRQFFTNKDGINAIDAVCFVVQAALARLTHTQKYIFDAILSVFGKDIASNIITLVTFADAKSPPVLEAIKEADIPCAKKTDGTLAYFKFNNSALFANNIKENKDAEDSCEEDKEEDFDYMFWKMGKSSLKKFFSHLITMKTQSLSLTKEVLQERDRLEVTVEGLQPLIQKGLSTMEEIRTTEAALDKHKNQVEENKDFEYEVEVEKPQKINIPKGEFITNCLQCTFTCHHHCGIPKDEDKRGCVAIGSDGHCTVCPGKCIWNIHHNMEYRFETKRVKEKRTYQNLKAKFEEALGEQMTTESMMSHLKTEYDQVQEEVAEMMNTVNACLTRLKEIALRPDPLSTTAYIDLMIQSEQQECRPGYMERLQELTVVRQKAEMVQDMAKSDKSGFNFTFKDLRKRVFNWFKS